jgi:hypothetical protein
MKTIILRNDFKTNAPNPRVRTGARVQVMGPKSGGSFHTDSGHRIHEITRNESFFPADSSELFRLDRD